MAVCPSAGIIQCTPPGSFNTATFEVEFVATIRECIRRDMRKVCFIGDNCRIHNKEAMQAVVAQIVQEAAENGLGEFDYKVDFLSPYSPMLNCIEGCFGDGKRVVRQLLDGEFHDRVLGVVRQGWDVRVRKRRRSCQK
jgi:hypothetical protein